MARGRSQNDNYIIGNTAIAYDEQRVERPKTTPRLKRRPSMDPKSTMGLLLMIVMVFGVVLLMLKAQFAVAEITKEVTQARATIQDLKSEQAHLEALYQENLNLVEIRRIATEEYGMIYPTAEHVIRIKEEKKSYAVQLKPIQVQKRESKDLGNLLAFITKGW